MRMLSQSQIDELLSELSVSNPTKSEPKIKKTYNKYDFKQPRKFTKEQIKTLSSIYENFSRHVSAFFTGTLRTYCQIEVGSIEETRYNEYINALPESVLLGVVEMEPLDGSVIIEFSKAITFLIIDKLLGGQGNSVNFNRDFTDIELTLMEGVYKKVIAYLRDSWEHIIEVEPKFINFETNSRFSQLMPLDEIIVIIVLNVTIRNITGSISICMPYLNLESVIEHLNTRNRFSLRVVPQEESEQIRNNLLEQLKGTVIDITGILGNTTLTLKELVSLKVGDVILLSQKVGDNIEVHIGNKARFYAEPGIHRNRKAIKIKAAAE